MEQLGPATDERAELDALAGELRAISPRREHERADPSADIHAIEKRSLRATLNRRWAAATALTSAACLAAGLLWSAVASRSTESAAPVVLAAGDAAAVLKIDNATALSTVSDLGADVARVLARPHARYVYDPSARHLVLEQGSIVAHVVPRGLGFRVSAPTVEVEVTGTVFAVNAETGTVRVYRGSVLERRRGIAGPERQLSGSNDYAELTQRDLEALGISEPTAAAAEPADTPTTAPPVERPRRRRDNAVAPPPMPIHEGRRLILAAQAELTAGRPERARAILVEHETRFSSSVLAEEVALLLLRAAVELGDDVYVRRQGRAFLEQFPGSSRVGEIQALVERAAAGAQPPR